MQDNVKALMDELALVMVKLVETAVYTAVSDALKAKETVEQPVVEAAAVEEAPKEKAKSTRRVFPKACPVCGVENVRRLYSYLCKEHATEENKAKYRGWMKPVEATATKVEADVAHA